MQMSKSLVVFSAACLAAATAFDPITLTVGTTAFVASGASVAAAAGALAALAIAKEALIFAAIKTNRASRGGRGGRGRRETEKAVEESIAKLEEKVSFDMVPIFKAIVEADSDDCAKAMVCHAFATPESQRRHLEASVVNLMGSQLEKINQDPALGVFQVAAIAGKASGNHALCSTMYSSCTKTQEDLANLVPVAPVS